MSWSTNRYQSTPSFAKKKVGKSLDEIPTQHLSNGAVGIDFHQLSKPANLSNSAVLKMLEEEREDTNRRWSRKPGVKEILWPPLHNTDESEEPHNNMYSPQPQNNYTYSNNVDSHPPPFRPVHFSPPPTTITLRPSAPISQSSPPVVVSQPATASIRGGARCRGDQKWPPESYKQQAQVENEARLAVAKGPAFRPKKVRRDYMPFFAKNALPSSYPGYKVPPGTQHYFEDQQVATDF